MACNINRTGSALSTNTEGWCVAFNRRFGIMRRTHAAVWNALEQRCVTYAVMQCVMSNERRCNCCRGENTLCSAPAQVGLLLICLVYYSTLSCWSLSWCDRAFVLYCSRDYYYHDLQRLASPQNVRNSITCCVVVCYCTLLYPLSFITSFVIVIHQRLNNSVQSCYSWYEKRISSVTLSFCDGCYIAFCIFGHVVC